MSIETVLFEDHGPVRVLTLNRPNKKNAFNVALGRGVKDRLLQAAEDDSVQVVVITGAGSAFSAGADMQMFFEMTSGGAGDISQVALLDNALMAFEKPLIAAVNGIAVGMGVTLLPCFDMVYAAESARFTTPFVRLGLVVEFGSSYGLTRLLGRQRTNELVLRARGIDAPTAERWGLVTRMFPDDELLDRVLEIAQDVADNSANGVRHCKRLIRNGEDASREDAKNEESVVLGKCYGSPDHIAAVMKFLNRKKK